MNVFQGSAAFSFPQIRTCCLNGEWGLSSGCNGVGKYFSLVGKYFSQLILDLLGEDGGFYLRIETAAVFFQVYDCVHSSYKDFLVCAQL